MPLKIKQSNTFLWPVTVMIPVDGGRFDKQTFDVEFARLSVTEAEQLVTSIATGERTEFEGYRDMIKGWRGVVDDGAEVPFSDTTLKQLLEIPTVGPAVLAAYKEATSEVARRKN